MGSGQVTQSALPGLPTCSVLVQKTSLQWVLVQRGTKQGCSNGNGGYQEGTGSLLCGLKPGVLCCSMGLMCLMQVWGPADELGLARGPQSRGGGAGLQSTQEGKGRVWCSSVPAVHENWRSDKGWIAFPCCTQLTVGLILELMQVGSESIQ